MLQGEAFAACLASGQSFHVLAGQEALGLHNNALEQRWDRIALQLSPPKCA